MSETRIEIVVTGDNAESAMQQITEQLQHTDAILSAGETAPTAMDLITGGVRASADLGLKVEQWFTDTTTSGGLQPFTVLALCVAVFAIAYLVERAFKHLASHQIRSPGTPAMRADARLGRALRWACIEALGLCVFYFVSLLVINLIFNTATESSELAAVALSSVVLPRAWLLVIEALSGSRDAARRANKLTDGEAAKIARSALVLVVILGCTAFIRDFVVSVVDAQASGALFAVFTRLVDGIAAAVFFVSIQTPVGNILVRSLSVDPKQPSPLATLSSRFWPALYIALFALQMLAEARGYLSGTLTQDASALKRSFAVFVLAPFFVAALGIWRATLVARADQTSKSRIAGVFSLLEGIVTVGAAITILYAWNIDPFATDLEGAKRILPGLISAAIVTVIGVSAWRTLSGFLTTGGDNENQDQENHDSEGGAGGSRIDTVLPILRTTLAVLIGAVTILLALASLGVQIAPLLAGAGILGLAVGFGAQKIVEDIISGVLYLIEDAFRKGEYIETSQGKGVVESIMLRSVRLRHHLGAVYTVPFSSMGTIQNHSRDWVTVKLSFEVSPTQDLEKVRKLIKKVGVQLMEDPELEGQFLAPLKSQGAVALVGSNYKIGVKFTSKPGEQFLIRRKALNAIQKAFSENEIQMAAPRVIVDTLESGEAAAAKMVIDGPLPV